METVECDMHRWKAHEEEWSNGVLLDTPDSWDGDDAAEHIALSYVATLEARMDAAGISREKWAEAPAEKRWQLREDDDGHWYLVPVELAEAFEAYVDEEGEWPEGVVTLSGHPSLVTFAAPELNGERL